MRIQQWPSVLPIGQPFHSPQMRYSKMSWPICMSVCICLYRWCMSLKLSQELYLIIGEFRNLIIFFFQNFDFFSHSIFFSFHTWYFTCFNAILPNHFCIKKKFCFSYQEALKFMRKESWKRLPNWMNLWDLP